MHKRLGSAPAIHVDLQLGFRFGIPRDPRPAAALSRVGVRCSLLSGAFQLPQAHGHDLPAFKVILQPQPQALLTCTGMAAHRPPHPPSPGAQSRVSHLSARRIKAAQAEVMA